MIKKPPIVAIVGRANVGKSSIFNVILRRRETIVAREAGTTRDSIMAKANYKSADFWLVDTAGLKDAEDNFEATIQEQIAQAVDSADIIVVVIEASAVLTREDREVAKLALKSKKPVILLVNKLDQVKNFEIKDYQGLGISEIYPLSATQQRGFDNFLDYLISTFPKYKFKYEPNIVRLALIGRPNVGKSQLFNSLLQKQQAIVSDRAGTTRDLNHTSVRYENKEIELIDTAGIRRSGKIERGIEKFSVIRTLSAIEQSDISLLLMDVNELNVQLDQKIAGMVKEAGKGLILVVSKWDTIEDKDSFTQAQMIAQIKHNYSFVPWATLVFTSSITGQNVTKLFALSLDIMKQRSQQISTPTLNKWLKTVIAKHPPAGLKNTSPKLNYIIQEQDNPSPTFKIYGSHARLVHWSYKRYLEREMRASFGFEGSAIKFWFFEKHIDKLKEPRKVKTD